MRFIALLTSHLEAAGFEVHHASADRLIVLTALDVADTCAASVLVGEDTDLLILLTVLLDPEKDIKMLMPGRKGHPDKVYSSAASRSALGGKAFLCVVYGGKIDDNLDVKRHQLYLRTIAKQKVCAKFELATLPPTSAAVRQHSFRGYHQVQQWRGVALNRTDWGWRLKDGRLTPLPTLREPAPESLLHLITCNCRPGCERKILRVSAKRTSIYIDVWILCGTWLQQPRYER